MIDSANYEEVEEKSDLLTFNWIEFSEDAVKFPKNAVHAGYDIDNVPFYVIRKQYTDATLYGKYARNDKRKNAYVTKDRREIGVQCFDLLIAKKYSWCELNSFKSYVNSLPICRAHVSIENQETMIPGTLLNNVKCRIGYAKEVYEVEPSHVDVLVIGSC